MPSLLHAYCDRVLDALSERYVATKGKIPIGLSSPVPETADPDGWWLHAIGKLFLIANEAIDQNRYLLGAHIAQPLHFEIYNSFPEPHDDVLIQREMVLIFAPELGDEDQFESWRKLTRKLVHHTIDNLKTGWVAEEESGHTWYNYDLEVDRAPMMPLIFIAAGHREKVYNPDEKRFEILRSPEDALVALRVRDDVIDHFLKPAGFTARDLTPEPAEPQTLQALVPRYPGQHRIRNRAPKT